MTTCDIPDELVQQFRQWNRTRVYPSIFVMKINKDTLKVEFERSYEGTQLEEMTEDLPESSPRFLGYICEYEKADRKTYPMVLIYYCPSTSTAQATLYSSTLTRLERLLQIPRTYRVDDATTITSEWMLSELKKF